MKDLRVGILELFAEVQDLGRVGAESRWRIHGYRADVQRTKHRACVVEQELNLRARLRRDVRLIVCRLCGARVEWRVGNAQLASHACADGVRAPTLQPFDMQRARKLQSEGLSFRAIARAMGTSHVTVSKRLR